MCVLLHLGIVFSLLGLVVSVAFVKDTSQFTALEIKEDLEFRKRAEND
jgi:hypothetical protein